MSHKILLIFLLTLTKFEQNFDLKYNTGLNQFFPDLYLYRDLKVLLFLQAECLEII